MQSKTESMGEAQIDISEELARIADRIRHWRNEAGLTLQVLGERSSVAASTIHKIENCQTIPTIAVLLKVVHALGRDPEQLLLDTGSSINITHTRPAERRQLDANSGSEIEQLSRGISTGTLDVWRVTHPPDRGMDPEHMDFSLHYDGELLIMCEEGHLDVEVGSGIYALRPGDTLHFKTSLPHLWRNNGAAPVRALIFAARPGGLHRGISEGFRSTRGRGSISPSES
ncbi:MAG: helix-turn-helix domain-containing protein [Deltaproteobacteria bacterium]|nr:helix-turn-helix domain-containing protein [Deltaproteobacteria bacterium]MBW2417163.1 helix-turn-helix domain-containing protein [Deltaproteobacteria bacterium]